MLRGLAAALKAIATPATARASAAERAADLDEKANILVVDDLPDKLLVFRTILEELGQNIVIVALRARRRCARCCSASSR